MEKIWLIDCEIIQKSNESWPSKNNKIITLFVLFWNSQPKELIIRWSKWSRWSRWPKLNMKSILNVLVNKHQHRVCWCKNWQTFYLWFSLWCIHLPAINKTIRSGGSSWSMLNGCCLTQSSRLGPSSIRDRWSPSWWYQAPNSSGKLKFLSFSWKYVDCLDKSSNLVVEWNILCLVLLLARSSRLE